MFIIKILQGIVLGVAAVVPGFSTSVAALLMGIYEDLIDALSSFRRNFKKNLAFLFQLAIGGIIGVLLSIGITLKIIERFPAQSFFFFTGLVLGGLPMVFRKITKKKFAPLYLIITALTFAIMYAISLVSESGSTSFISIATLSSASDFLQMIFAGIFSVSLMIIPGVSGSIMLVLIGQYGTVYNAANSGVTMLKALASKDMPLFKEALSSVLLLLPFILGALLGVLIISKILKFLLDNFETQVYYGVLGILISSITAMVKLALSGTAVGMDFKARLILIGSSAVCVIVGIICTVYMDNPEKKSDFSEVQIAPSANFSDVKES